MTFLEKAILEKAKKDYTEIKENIVNGLCPYELGLENKYKCGRGQCLDECVKCWNREMPSEVQQAEEVKMFEQNLGKLVDSCMDAIRKQIPEKPFLWGDGYADGKMVYDMYSCPNCEKSYEIEERYRYCPNCG